MTENENKTIKELRYIHKRCDNEGRYSECDALENAICAIEENQQYHAIGTVEECCEAMEKQRARKPILRKDGTYDCVCGNIVTKTECYCEDCGQKLDWSEEGGVV